MTEGMASWTMSAISTGMGRQRCSSTQGVWHGDLGDLRHPGHGQAGERLDPVLDYEAGVHARRHFRADVEAEPVRGDRAQVSRIAKEDPCLGECYRQHLELI